MSSLIEILSLILSADAGGSGAIDNIQTCASAGGICSTSSFTAMAAAYTTQGYYVQSDLLYYLTQTNMGNIAPLLYAVAAIGGLVALALGAPPKMYLWFFIGPGIYHWLLDARLPTNGVQWTIAGVNQDQREVWRLAEVGLKNLPIVERLSLGAHKMEYEGSDVAPKECKPPTDPVYVSYFFLTYDEIVSSVVQHLIKWTGIYSQAGGSGEETGILPLPSGATANDRWYLLASQKWSLLDTITSAHLTNPDARDLLATFMSSECGDSLMENIDQRNFVAASNSKTGRLPCSIISGSDDSSTATTFCSEIEQGDGSSLIAPANYERLYQDMQKSYIPIPGEARRMLRDTTTGSFSQFMNGSGPVDPTKGIFQYFSSRDGLECPALFYMVVEAFRWETGHIYHQLVSRTPAGMGEDEMLYNLFYGWNVRDRVSVGGKRLTATELEDYTKNLIFIHLLRNEFVMTQRVADPKLQNDTQLMKGSDAFVGQTGAKTKFSEIYSWARMIPYIQGIFLYLLALGYPFACVLVVMPGWHKSLFTWMSFWLWVKLWDVGFALVLVIERSIWSTIGNNSTVSSLSPLINNMRTWGGVVISTKTASKDLINSCAYLMGTSAAGVPTVVDRAADGIQWWNAAALFDRALLVGSSIDLDVSNGYYIYIMSALYFAVPAITGQLVLGAKSGMSSFVGNFTDGAKGDGSNAAKSAYTGDFAKNAQSANAAGIQSGIAKTNRQNGLALQAIEAGNQQLDQGLQGQRYEAQSSLIGAMQQNLGKNLEMQKSALGLVGAANKADLTLKQLNASQAQQTFDALGRASQSAPRLGATKSTSGVGGTGAATPSTVTADGVTRLGAVGELGSNLGGVASQAQYQTLARQSAALDSRQQQQSYGYDAATQPTLANMTSQQAGLGLARTATGAAGAGFGMQERRTSSAAQFASEEGGYLTRRSLAQSSGGALSALGVDNSWLSPGQKPTEMVGMAMSGMLGAAAKAEGNYASSGGEYWSSYGSAFFGSGSLGSQYGVSAQNPGAGSSAVSSAFAVTSPKAVSTDMFGGGGSYQSLYDNYDSSSKPWKYGSGELMSDTKFDTGGTPQIARGRPTVE